MSTASGIKVMQTWRLPKDLIHWLRNEAQRTNYELTPYATRLLQAYRNYYEVPVHEANLLEKERKSLRLRRFEYLQHILSRHTLDLQRGAAKVSLPSRERPPSGEKVMQTWRMPGDLIVFLREEAIQRTYELTPFAIKLLQAYRNYYEVPVHEAILLDRERETSPLGRFEYFQHLLSRHSLALHEQNGDDSSR